MLKISHQELIRPSPSCMPPYCLGWKFNYDDDIIIVYGATSNKTNFVLENMMKKTNIS
jgi:hypothetical protein